MPQSIKKIDAIQRDNIKDAAQLAASPRVVSVSLPAAVAYDLDKFQKIQKDILGQLGCLACCSGWDIRWDLETRFVVDQNLRISSGFNVT